MWFFIGVDAAYCVSAEMAKAVLQIALAKKLLVEAI